MFRHLQWYRSRLVICGAFVGMAVLAIGCRSAETRQAAPLAGASATERPYNPPALYVPPALDDGPEEKNSAPPAPVPRDDGGLSWMLRGRDKSELKPVSSEVSDAPRLLSPGRAKSLRDFISTGQSDGSDRR